MSHRSRIIWVLALLVAVPLAAACGAAEEPAANAANAPADEAPAPEPEPEPEPATPETTEPEDTASQEPELVGEIRVSNEDFEWGETTTESAAYTWTARVTNDTTATLAITVRFEFLNEDDAVIKTESATVRLDPAASRTINESGNMNYDQANEVFSFRAVTDYEIVDS